MGARKKNAPKRGSLSFSPRKRARSINPIIKYWPVINVNSVKPLGFAGYKVGMTHVFYIDNYRFSPYAGQEVFSSVTIVETPPLKVVGIAGYTIDAKNNCLINYKTAYAPEAPDFIKRRIVNFSSSTSKKNLEELESNIENIRIWRLLVSTQPIVAGIHKKTPEIFELQLGGNTGAEEKFSYAKDKLGGDLKVEEVFKPGEVIDTIAVTKGKGFQSPVKRWGIKLLPHKSRKSRRKPGALGPWKPSATRYTVPLSGQTGFHRRTIYHVKILGIKKPEEFDHQLSFRKYGVLKNDFLLLKGSVPGAVKRLIKMRYTVRPVRKASLQPVDITYMDL